MPARRAAASQADVEREPREDDPVTLQEACEIVFRGTCTPATLRLEAARGRLDIARIGKRDYTTLRSARDLFDKCREEKAPRDYISTRRAVSGSSETDRISFAQAAVRISAERLRSSSQITSPAATGRSRARTR